MRQPKRQSRLAPIRFGWFYDEDAVAVWAARDGRHLFEIRLNDSELSDLVAIVEQAHIISAERHRDGGG